MQVLGPHELKKTVLDQDLCVGCGACADLCPYLKIHRGRAVMLFDCDLEMGRCYAYCPKTRSESDGSRPPSPDTASPEHPLGCFQRIVIARAGPGMEPGSFQSGGTVSTLIAFALETERIQQAVLTGLEGLQPVPRTVASSQDALACAGSKYMLTPTLAALNQSLKHGLTQTGLVGTPCQASAAARMRSNPMQQDGFQDPLSLVIGLFCTWSLDPCRFAAYLAQRLGPGEHLLTMDIPPPPAKAMEVQTDSQRLYLPLDDIRPLIPKGCAVCQDMTAESADISVGVLEEDPSWNLVLVRSETGADLLRAAEEADRLETRPAPPESIQQLVRAAARKKHKEVQP